ncbi:DUF6607 family protein [Sphingomonas solaris]|uniref:Uncharacterized protein n=1 Tax=Alterirhizorhabdus solaris TaxID=2529389 RepID=A0A558QYT3_9SPHN|nr:DUF6607 family protein [Sphingomonas solaris]TVV72217.1 hypothetical protein FOY91_15145 [Sphingomonas solaris]
MRFFRLTLAAMLLTAAPAMPLAAIPPAVQAAPAGQVRDQAAILAMAGTYKVTFDMRETVPFVAGYTPLPARVSGGYEVVKAIADRPGFVSLQHMLVVDGEKAPVVVKHWRQDWTWQPASVLAYVAPGRWALRPVPAGEAQGAWSQTVWQTDDSPRYGALGRWRYDDGVARWTSEETRRPLARRDATRAPPYDHYVGTNRHALTPAGWVHEQDNAKVGTKDGATVTFVHEYLVNSYVRSAAFPIAAAEAYWAKTSAYWATVRAGWDRAIAAGRGLRLGEEGNNGSITGHELMLLADDVASGDVTPAQATVDAAEVIAKATRE